MPHHLRKTIMVFGEPMGRGGMSSNAFAGRTRLDRLNLTELLQANAPPEKLAYLETIADATNNYLYFGLGKNGTTPDEFAWAWNYFFRIRSSEPSTWEQARIMRVCSEESGKRSTCCLMLTDDQLIDMCFDTHYEFSGLSEHMTIFMFLKQLKQVRKTILTDNMIQVSSYLAELRSMECKEIAPGWQLPLNLQDPVQVLTDPNGAEEIAYLLYYPERYKHPPTRREVLRQAAAAR